MIDAPLGNGHTVCTGSTTTAGAVGGNAGADCPLAPASRLAPSGAAGEFAGGYAAYTRNFEQLLQQIAAVRSTPQ